MKILKSTAKVLSWASHPLFTSCIIVIVFSMEKYSFSEAMLIMGILILGMIVPLNIFTYLKVKQGSYSDFDVSNRKQRSSLYIVVILIMLMVSFLLRSLQVDAQIVNSCFLTTILFIVVFILNFKIKLSLHVCLNTYFCFILYQISPITALIAAMILPLIALSRICLKRHSLSEVLTGSVVGICFGVILISLNRNFSIPGL